MKYCWKCFFINPNDNPPICGEGYKIKKQGNKILRDKKCIKTELLKRKFDKKNRDIFEGRI